MAIDGTALINRVVTAQEAAKFLGIEDRTVRSMCERGELRAVKCGRVWRINLTETVRALGLDAPKTSQA